jgi:hypothetical protein
MPHGTFLPCEVDAVAGYRKVADLEIRTNLNPFSLLKAQNAFIPGNLLVKVGDRSSCMVGQELKGIVA